MSDNLKLVIAIRHGEDNKDHLTEQGQKDIRSLAEHLRQIIPPWLVVKVLTSRFSRAIESGDIIAQALDTSTTIDEVLELDRHKYGELMMKAILSSSGDAEAVVVITHYSAPSGIMNAFSSERFQQTVDATICPKGNGHMIDLTTGQVTMDLLT